MQRQSQSKSKPQAPQKGSSEQKSKSRRPRRRNGRVETFVSAPTSSGVIQTGRAFEFTFSRAPTHDRYPQGGLRIVGRLAPLDRDSITLYTSTSGGYTGAFGTGQTCLAVCPNTLATSGWSGSGGYVINDSLFGSNSSVELITKNFREYRLRKCWLNYRGGANSNGVSLGTSLYQGEVAFGYDPTTSDYTNYAFGSLSNSRLMTQNAERGPWYASFTVKLIDDKRQSLDDQLYRISNAASMTSADMMQCVQGLIIANNSVQPSAITGGAVATVGNYDFTFVLDLYGLMPTASSSLTLAPSGDRKLAGPEPALLTRTSDSKMEPKIEPSPALKDPSQQPVPEAGAVRSGPPPPPGSRWMLLSPSRDQKL